MIFVLEKYDSLTGTFFERCHSYCQ